MPEKPIDVDQYLEIGCGRCELGGTPDCKVRPWTKVLQSLRQVLLASGLTEEIKWSVPCYTHNGRNIVTVSALKECAALSFFRGAELADTEGVLEKPGENSRFARYLKFTSTKRVRSLRKVIARYVQEAIELEVTGKKAFVDDAMPKQPDELTEMFKSNPKFRGAFNALTPGRQRGYLLHFSSAKQSKTKTARIEKCVPKIFDGKGWNER